MINIAFWNINKKEVNVIQPYVEKLIEQENIKILFLIEDILDVEKVKLLLKYKVGDYKKRTINFYVNDDIYISPCQENSSKYLGIKIKYRGIEFYIYGVHLNSNLYNDDNDRAMQAKDLKNTIKDLDKCLVIGDFNSEPFERTIVGASGFSALPTINLPNRTTIIGKINNLYNPMWRFFGDFEDYPGTYYYSKSNSDINYYWHIYDQVLISYGMINNFNKNSIKIIKKIGENTLIKNSKINRNISDHLPVVFSIEEENYGK